MASCCALPRLMNARLSMNSTAGKTDPEREAIGKFNMRFMGMVQSANILAAASVADKSGLFKLLADAAGPMSVAEISKAGNYHPRYVLELCSCLACADFLTYDKETDKFEIEPAQAKLLTDPDFALGVGGWLGIVPALHMAVPGVTKAMQTPNETTGVSFQQQQAFGFADGMARLNGPGIKSALVRKWLPDNLKEKLTAGIKVADLGTGQGALCMTLANAFPNSAVTGIDIDAESIDKATSALTATALTNANFICKDMGDIEPEQYDLIVNHDCIHDLADPVGMLSSVRKALKPGGIFFSMEPKAKDSLAEQLRPEMAQAFAMSTLHCITVSLAQGGPGLGSGTFGPKTYEGIATQAGFTSFEVVGGNVVNNFYELSCPVKAGL